MTTIDPTIGGIILCGGRGRRIGSDKAWLRFGDEHLLQRMVRIIGDVVSPVVVAGRPGQSLPALPDDVAIVYDAIEDAGPLAGVAAGMVFLEGTCDSAFVAACDYPLLSSSLMRRLIGLDENDISHVWAYTPDRERRKIIARLDPNEKIEPYTCADDAREAIADKKREQAMMHKASRAYAKRTKTVAQRASEHARAKRRELMATGTEGGQCQPSIVPVRTGFENVSNAARSTFETESFRPEDAGDMDDLFDGPERLGVVDDGDDDGGMEDLFVDEPAIDTEPDEGLDEL